MKNNNYIYLIVGPSGSGKTTLVDALYRKYRLKPIESYTTRPPRCEAEEGHIFVSKEEFDKLDNKVAYTCYNEYEYCATAEQVDECDLYVIDPQGIDYFMENYHGNKEVVIVYISVNEYVRYKRMKRRGDSFMSIMGRLEYDGDAFRDVRYDFLIDGECSVRRMTRQFNKKIKQHRKKVRKE